VEDVATSWPTPAATHAAITFAVPSTFTAWMAACSNGRSAQ
jgi:hypothetical protein